MVYLLESLNFQLACSSFLSSKFASQVNTICGGAQLLVSGCLESMCHKFNSQGLGLRILELMIAGPKSGGFNSRVPGLRSQGLGLRSQGLRVPGSRISGPWVSGLRVPGLRSQGLGSQDPGSQGPGCQVPGSRVSGFQSRVSGSDFRLCRREEVL